MPCHRQLHPSLRKNIRSIPVHIIGQTVYFWSGNNGWTVAGIVDKHHKHAVDIAHSRMVKTAHCYRVRAPPLSRTIVDKELTPPHEDNTEHSGTPDLQDCEDAENENEQLLSVEISPRNLKKPTREAKQPAKESQKIIEFLH